MKSRLYNYIDIFTLNLIVKQARLKFTTERTVFSFECWVRIKFPRPLDIDAVIWYYRRKSKPYAESLERWRVLAESWKGDSVLGSFRLTRLGIPIVSSVTGGYDGLFDSLFTSIGGDIILSRVSTKLGVVKDSLGINGAGLVGMRPERDTDVSMTMLFDLDMHVLWVLGRCLFVLWVLWVFCEECSKYAVSKNLK